MSLPRTSVFVGLSLDGFIAGEQDDLSWLDPYGVESPEATGYAALMASVDTLVIGRHTYDVVCGFPEWPYGGKRVVVLTHQTLAARPGCEFWSGQLRPLFERLHQEGTRHIYLDGGAAIRAGLAEDLVDELTLTWVPVILGRGVPLFGEPLPQATWELHDSRSFASGPVQARYRKRGIIAP
ncbi:dihydrofolate reductase family protein [Massilia sp. TS11]|uniref:dihydrofolate reductase family protein n=1 Tax=Massilia sp. TS11 TaxID=2908003 RepID=UPI001EDB7852|nr:dihydrofolate reductase family protein [Massilia sp. TS11]MCG2585627.1 dihydrofolate reductase family protein [Massilia sp. TS11]